MWPEDVGEALVDDGDGWRLFVVDVIEAPATNDLDTHRLEVFGAHHVRASEYRTASIDRVPLGLQGGADPDVAHRNRKGEAHVLDPGNGPYPPSDLGEERSVLASLCNRAGPTSM